MTGETGSRARAEAFVVQLPFPSTSDANPVIHRYYTDYERRFSRLVRDFFIPAQSLWEMPLWVAHLAGMLEAVGTEPVFLDLSGEAPQADICLRRVLAETSTGSVVMLSPLAQNLQLALTVSQKLIAHGRRTIIGGNMAPLVNPKDCTQVYRGLLNPEKLRAILAGTQNGCPISDILTPRGRISWAPSYRLLRRYHGKVPLLRLMASHGCLYACSFCGDAWSQKLYVTDPGALESEVRDFETLFPETRLIYIGDKTFGQSKEAVANLLSVFSKRRQYRFIVQTHICAVNTELIETMKELGVIAAEVGFESGSKELLADSHKTSVPETQYLKNIDRIRSAGIEVILNVLGGLPQERAEDHESTIRLMRRWSEHVFLYNLYNFVPYPLTPVFESLRERITDWNFEHWREDAPPVFVPYHQTIEQSWNRFLEKVEVAHELVRRAPGRETRTSARYEYSTMDRAAQG